MNWDKLISSQRFGKELNNNSMQQDRRSEFQRDYDRIIFSSPFRRMQNKTQVFPLPGSVFVHNRLTHSLEVACVGRSLGNMLAARLINDQLLERNFEADVFGSIVSAACLAHDMGNPPFGHSGEKAISAFFTKGQGQELRKELSEQEWQDCANFEGNANALRLLTHSFTGRRKGGYALTFSTLGSLVKYPTISLNRSNKNKYGVFSSEEKSFKQIAEHLGLKKLSNGGFSYARHPLVYLVEAADDICYQLMDLEDALKLKILGYEEIESLLMAFLNENPSTKQSIENTFKEVTDQHERISYLRAHAVNKLVNECIEVFIKNYSAIMDGDFKSTLIDDLEGDIHKGVEKIKKVNFKEVYKYRAVVEIELAGFNIMGGLLDEFTGAVLNKNAHYSQKLLSLLPEQFKHNKTDMYSQIQSVLDFISGMTDLYATDLFRDIKGINHKTL
jgi:dGTPase